MPRSAVALALALVALGAGCGGGGEEVALRGSDVPERPPAPDLSLRDQNGAEVTMAAQRGRWVIVTFLYTYCPDVCPVIAGNLNAVLRTARAKRAGLRVLVVSVDPKRDTPAAVRRYAGLHRLLPSFHWLVGSRAELRRVWRAYHVAVLPGPKGTITHSTFQLLVDPEGRERLVYDSTAQTAEIVRDLRLLEGED
jgi:protein SCO1/2